MNYHKAFNHHSDGFLLGAWRLRWCQMSGNTNNDIDHEVVGHG